jgi:hypothetical protein
MKIAEKITGLGIKDINVYLTFHIITIFFFLPQMYQRSF